MAHKRRRPRILLDTSAVVQQLHGHTLQRAAVREAVSGAELQVPIFVRMEYLRGVILNLIEMWCLIRESVTVEDAFIDWSQKMKQERKLKAILMTVPRWLGGQEDSRSWHAAPILNPLSRFRTGIAAIHTPIPCHESNRDRLGRLRW